MAPSSSAPVLPVSVIGLVDLGRLIRELEQLENTMSSEHLRTGKEEDAITLPKISTTLEQVAELNHVDLAYQHNRQSMLTLLKQLHKEAPRAHLSFSADPQPQFMMKVVTWLRTNIHPHLLVAVGLQPGIGAGCVLRTTNHFFDMSLGSRFAGSRELLMKRLREPVPGQSAVPDPLQAIISPEVPA
ncbi:hypothetical protein JNM87_00140 [Candidatus Saccharibacteria bacterium]|nr:hypothetical protein [Candidatus Saccharibacteria bacterium]